MFDSSTIADMSKRHVKTIAIYARIPESDVAELDKAADEELVSRSNMVARVVREWAKKRLSPKKPAK